MKFRRKSAEPPATSSTDEATDLAEATEAAPRREAGPYDYDAVEHDVERLDLGALLLEPVDGIEVRLQVDEDQNQVQSLLLATDDGAVELRAFAAPRGGDLWSDVRRGVAAEYTQRGGTATPREGRYGTELDCLLTVRTEDGRTGTQLTRVVGINGERWMVRATFVGRPAAEPDLEGPWTEALERVVVRRGAHAMPVGAELPLSMPPQATRG